MSVVNKIYTLYAGNTTFDMDSISNMLDGMTPLIINFDNFEMAVKVFKLFVHTACEQMLAVIQNENTYVDEDDYDPKMMILPSFDDFWNRPQPDTAEIKRYLADIDNRFSNLDTWFYCVIDSERERTEFMGDVHAEHFMSHFNIGIRPSKILGELPNVGIISMNCITVPVSGSSIGIEVLDEEWKSKQRYGYEHSV